MTVAKGRKKGNRTGFTTGACAAAAARAAALGLVNGVVPDSVTCVLPNANRVNFPVESKRCNGRMACAVVVKDAGDDPDVTNKARLTACLHILPGEPGTIRLEGGDGVGRVTRLGLGLAIGGPAFNPVPHANIRENIHAAAASLLEQMGILARISVPGGEKMAGRTLNPRLGILGGISILGTSGIVRPYSTAAFRDSVIQAIEVAAAQGQSQARNPETVVLTTGRRTESFAMATLPELEPVCFVQMGDFVGRALETVVRVGIRQVVVAGMVGKLTKIAQGETITHAGRGPINRKLLAEIAAAAGAPNAVCDDIRVAETARYASERMAELGLTAAFHRELALRVVENLAARHPGKYTVRVLVCSFDGEILTEESGGSIHD